MDSESEEETIEIDIVESSSASSLNLFPSESPPLEPKQIPLAQSQEATTNAENNEITDNSLTKSPVASQQEDNQTISSSHDTRPNENSPHQDQLEHEGDAGCKSDATPSPLATCQQTSQNLDEVGHHDEASAQLLNEESDGQHQQATGEHEVVQVTVHQDELIHEVDIVTERLLATKEDAEVFCSLESLALADRDADEQTDRVIPTADGSDPQAATDEQATDDLTGKEPIEHDVSEAEREPIAIMIVDAPTPTPCLLDEAITEEDDDDYDHKNEGDDLGEINWQQELRKHLEPLYFEHIGGGKGQQVAPSDDLEWEFDHEPEFEKRQVYLKVNINPRDQYLLGDELGRGKFGTVFRCQEMTSGRNFAAKFVYLRRKEDREDVIREIEIMSLLQHRRLLQLYDAFDDGHQEMCLVTELIEGGELFEQIVSDSFELTEKRAAIFMRQICEGVEYMHSQNIVHLDMKPENILCVSRTGNRIKLIDFGLARRLDSGEPLRVMFGTPDFAAPEVLSYETVSLATDMWSVGVICYVLLSGLSPFMGNSDMETMANVTRATFDFDDPAFEPISDLAKDFISRLLVKEQARRLTPSQCLQHAWLQRGGAQLEAAVQSRRQSMAIAAGLASHRASLSVSQPLVRLPPTLATHHYGVPMSVPALNSLLEAGTGGPRGQHQNWPMEVQSEPATPSFPVHLDKRNLKRYVVRRKWHKSVHAITALRRMGAQLTGDPTSGQLMR